MDTIIFVAIWTYKEGEAIGTFTTAAMAEKWRQEIASDEWANEMSPVVMPTDPTEAADWYFNDEGNGSHSGEYFNVKPTALNG